MMRELRTRFILSACLMKRSLVAALLGAAVSITSASAAIYQFVVPLDGGQEFPGPGDPDGSGTAILFIDGDALTIDWDITVSGIDLPVRAAHIHNAPAGVSGPVRVDFSGQLTGSGLFDADLAGVLANPSQWYVNVHNAPFPAGAVRGQLGVPTVIPEPSTVLAGVALAGVAAGTWWQRRARRASPSE